MTVTLIDKPTAAEALRGAAFRVEDLDSPDYGRVLIHCVLGFIGADWDLDQALRLLSKATKVAWTDHILRHDLAIVADEKVYSFDVRRPEAVSA